MPADAAPGARAPFETGPLRPSQAVRLSQIHIWLLFLIPPFLRVTPLGSAGSPALVLATVMFLLWAFVVLSPSLQPPNRCPPVRIVLTVLLAAVLMSYGAMHRFSASADVVNSSDTFLVMMVAFCGVALFAAEGVRTMAELMILVRTFVAAVATMSAVAIMQAHLGVDLVEYIARIPLLSSDGDVTRVFSRGGIGRPAGTATHPIEFGVVAGIGLAFALHVNLYDRVWPRFWRRAALFLIALGIPVAVSRSALLVAVAVLIAFVAGSTNAVRVRTLPVTAGFLAVVFVAFPGLLGTLSGLIAIGGDDASITTRTSDYVVVDPLIRASPWLGLGPGAFLPRFRLLDNQFLLTLVEMGVIGLVAVLLAFLAIGWLGRGGRKRFADEGDRFLGQMFAGAAVGITLAAFTFDALKYLIFTAVVALLLGLAGRYRCLGLEEERARLEAPASASPPSPPADPPVGARPSEPAMDGTLRLREVLRGAGRPPRRFMRSVGSRLPPY